MPSALNVALHRRHLQVLLLVRAPAGTRLVVLDWYFCFSAPSITLKHSLVLRYLKWPPDNQP